MEEYFESEHVQKINEGCSESFGDHPHAHLGVENFRQNFPELHLCVWDCLLCVLSYLV